MSDRYGVKSICVIDGFTGNPQLSVKSAVLITVILYFPNHVYLGQITDSGM